MLICLDNLKVSINYFIFFLIAINIITSKPNDFVIRVRHVLLVIIEYGVFNQVPYDISPVGKGSVALGKVRMS